MYLRGSQRRIDLPRSYEKSSWEETLGRGEGFFDLFMSSFQEAPLWCLPVVDVIKSGEFYFRPKKSNCSNIKRREWNWAGTDLRLEWQYTNWFDLYTTLGQRENANQNYKAQNYDQ